MRNDKVSKSIVQNDPSTMISGNNSMHATLKKQSKLGDNDKLKNVLAKSLRHIKKLVMEA